MAAAESRVNFIIMKTASAARPPKPLRAGLIHSVVFSPAGRVHGASPSLALPAISMGEVAWPRSAGQHIVDKF